MTDNYLAYMLRLQRRQSTPHWRASLENAHTGEILQFATEKELLVYLMHVLRPQQQQANTFDENQQRNSAAK